MIVVVTDIDEMRGLSRKKRGEGMKVCLVPTMGALHEGHLSLVRIAKEHADFIVVSIFVNPTQFGPDEDYEKYPRERERDVEKLDALGVDAVFIPDVSAMYPEGYSTYVTVERLTEGLCGKSRPSHFRGVTTVVAKLFAIVEPRYAVFGRKDAQQLAVIRRMVRDLNLDIEILAGPIVREPDGLAMSSRNSYLSPEERRQATALYRALGKGEELFRSGVVDADLIVGKVREVIERESSAKIDYVELVDSGDMQPMDRVEGEALLAVAAWFGGTRLIDNVTLKG